MGIKDPIRPEIKEAIQKCKIAGIQICMCTGDNVKKNLHKYNNNYIKN